MVGKMNSRWQSDNPVRSIGEYLPLRRRCTHAALTQRNTRHVRGNTVMYAQRHAYVLSGMRRAAYLPTYLPIYACARICMCMEIYARVFLARTCLYVRVHARARARVRVYVHGVHRDASAGVTSRATDERENAHALCMNACTYTRAGWIYSRRNFAVRR